MTTQLLPPSSDVSKDEFTVRGNDDREHWQRGGLAGVYGRIELPKGFLMWLENHQRQHTEAEVLFRKYKVRK